MRLACLGPGQFFGEVELTHGGHSIASVQAARRGVEVALLPKEVFLKLVEGSPRTHDAIREIATSRRAENIDSRQQNL
jgi:CRP-like cAMP-binding protein